VLLLATDLLEAEGIGVDPDQLGAQDWNALIKTRRAFEPVVQVQQIEGGYAQVDGHGSSPIE
jgi:hypothetical protein